MSVTPVFDVAIDPARNVVRAKFAGQFSAKEMKAAADQIDSLLPQLRPGFSLFADFGQIVSMDIDCVPHLTRIMDRCRAGGIGLIVRVLPQPDRDIGINLLALVHYRGKVKTVTVSTATEAERALR